MAAKSVDEIQRGGENVGRVDRGGREGDEEDRSNWMEANGGDIEWSRFAVKEADRSRSRIIGIGERDEESPELGQIKAQAHAI